MGHVSPKGMTRGRSMSPYNVSCHERHKTSYEMNFESKTFQITKASSNKNNISF